MMSQSAASFVLIDARPNNHGMMCIAIDGDVGLDPR
jgi:hypothetical protein